MSACLPYNPDNIHLFESLEPQRIYRRHQHQRAYITLVIEGECIEAGEEGRVRLGMGDAIVRCAFSSHCNLIGAQGAKLLNLPYRGMVERTYCLEVGDPDQVVKAAERSINESVSVLFATSHFTNLNEADWPDTLAADLRSDTSISLYDWAANVGLAPATVSRGFAQVYGLSPKAYRGEMKARNAEKSIRLTHERLDAIAYSAGFADQAHMTRAIKAVFGKTPCAIRQSSNSRHSVFTKLDV